MASRLVGAKPLSEPVMTYCQLDPREQISGKYESKIKHFHWQNRKSPGLHVLINVSNMPIWTFDVTLRWRHNGRDSVSNHQSHHCLLNRLFRRRSKKTSKLRGTGLCVGNSPGTGEFPAPMASNAENVSIWWRNHDYTLLRQNGRVWHDIPR